MAIETDSNENESNVIFFTPEEALLMKILADELTKAVVGMDEVLVQARSLNAKMEEINRRLSELP